VNLGRREVDSDREALAKEREIIEREKKVAQRWRDADLALAAANEAAPPAERPS